nr:unnamed protein product [Digitaria exilis]
MLKLRCDGVSSGKGMSPSRYCITCRMLGLELGNGCEHSSPRLSASIASPASFASMISASESFCQCSSTQSTSMSRPSAMLFSMGLRPQTTSRMNAPKAYTSPIVPTTCVVCGSAPWSYSFARPKSPSRPFISLSSRTLLA